MSREDQVLAHRLRTHVERLAGEIGERNLFIPEALRRAAVYKWGTMGYTVERLEYHFPEFAAQTSSPHVREMHVRARFCCSARTTTRSLAVPAPMTTQAGIAALLMFQALEPILTVRFVAFVNEEPPFFLDPAAGKHGVRPGGSASG